MKNIKIPKKILITFFMTIVFVIVLYFGIPKLNRTANIVFTTDSKYTAYTEVALKSLELNKKPSTIYNITILAVDLNEEDIKRFKAYSKNKFIVNVQPLSLKLVENIGKYKVYNHVSRADLFKFLMPEILNQYDKILYLDSDILIKKDLLSLYNTEIRHRYLAAVRRYTPEGVQLLVYKLTRKVYYYPLYNYNCGILLLNLKKMRKDNIGIKFIEEKEKDRTRNLMTQKAFNKVIPDIKAKKLSPIYNAYSRWKDVDYKKHNFRRTYFPYSLTLFSVKDIYKKAAIIHYAGSVKPWNNNNARFSKEWWEYAKQISPQGQEMLYKDAEKNRIKGYVD